MPDLEKFAFDRLSQLTTRVVEARLASAHYSYLEQRKLRSRVESACADFVKNWLRFLEQEKTSPGDQKTILENGLKELEPFAADPSRRCTEPAPASGTFSFTQLADFFCLLTAAINADEAQNRAEGFRRFDEIALQAKAGFSRSTEVQRKSPKEESQPAAGPVSFDLEAFPAEAEVPTEQVSFTALYPREVGVETWKTLLVYVHLASVVDQIQKDAQRFKDELGAAKEVTGEAATPLARGTEITIVPQCEGITFNPKRLSLAWLEDFHRADFRFKADKSLAEDAARGSIDLYVGPLLIGSLKLALLVSEKTPAEPAQQEEQGSLYHQDQIFISYSHKDTEVVLAFKKAYEAIGQNVLIDIDELRSGQDWNAELLKMIEQAEIFQLYWSENSSQSKYCRQEWEYALKLNKGRGFIRPCYWKLPLPNPPEALGHLHFEFVALQNIP